MIGPVGPRFWESMVHNIMVQSLMAAKLFCIGVEYNFIAAAKVKELTLKTFNTSKCQIHCLSQRFQNGGLCPAPGYERKMLGCQKHLKTLGVLIFYKLL